MNSSIDRRSFATAGAAAAASLTMSGGAHAGDPAMSAPAPYEVKPLPFDPKKLSGLSEKLIVSHHDNNYTGAVKRLNAISAQLAWILRTAPAW